MADNPNEIKQVSITVDGCKLSAPAGSMLINATDKSDIYVPRFCYHHKLSVAANCRMCLVEVEKAPKPMPACATPVTDGMCVWTRSEKALAAQRAVMEFLLINHPLDCPICDQGGECELQDLAMGFGSDVSQYQERKRVVPQRDIGPLVQTDLTRCIHCTRCVRFGEEIAGLRELGAVGRGEHMEIGTYIEHALRSEISGNIIDLCPVGALTSKPFRYSARSWEMRQEQGVAPHDAVGSNVHLHIRDGRIMRVVPAANEAINESWLSDRDRFSYTGLYHNDRLTEPLMKNEVNNSSGMKPLDWETALTDVARQLQSIVKKHGPDQIGFIISPSATLEEHYLTQRLARGLGCHNIDHRLWQSDFRGQERAPLFPWLGARLPALEKLDSVLLIGAYPRHEQPLINTRLRKMATGHGAVMAINPTAEPFNYDLYEQITAAPGRLPDEIGALLRIKLERDQTDLKQKSAVNNYLHTLKPTAAHERIVQRLESGRTLVLLGEAAMAHPDFYAIWQLAGMLASHCDSKLGYLSPGANSAGACLAGSLPHRELMGDAISKPGLNARQMFEKPLAAYVLVGVEPEWDCWDGAQAIQSLTDAQWVVSLTGWETPLMRKYADALLPTAQYAETDGTFINAEGVSQFFAAASRSPGETKPGWKILRQLGHLLQLNDFDFTSCADIRKLLTPALQQMNPDNQCQWELPDMTRPTDNATSETLERYMRRPLYGGDPLVRRAEPLQQTMTDDQDYVRICPAAAERLKLSQSVRVIANGNEVLLPLMLDSGVPDGCIVLPYCQDTRNLGGPYGKVRLQSA